jgi:hypothetical protein
MLQYRTVAPATVELLKSLMQSPILTDFCLAGGTSLSLQIGHRESYDLDFFSNKPFSTDEIYLKLKQGFDANMVSQSEYILISLIKDIKVDCVFHPFPFKHNATEIDGIRLFHIEDIAAMKLAAVAGRGRKRDFYDLFYLLREFSLPQILDLYAVKYGEAAVFHAVRSLTYFGDAESDADPILFEKASWEKVKKSIQTAAAKV